MKREFGYFYLNTYFKRIGRNMCQGYESTWFQYSSDILLSTIQKLQ